MKSLLQWVAEIAFWAVVLTAIVEIAGVWLVAMIRMVWK